jgi:uncharacterized protein YfbU (UPF0304 family)
MSNDRGQRIEANCKIIWGNDSEYDLEMDIDYVYVHYVCFVRKDFGLSFGEILLTMTNECNSSEAAWTELDRMLELWANQVKGRTPIVRH